MHYLKKNTGQDGTDYSADNSFEQALYANHGNYEGEWVVYAELCDKALDVFCVVVAKHHDTHEENSV